ncbi:hypothetical protein DdX_07033 [Ditylenchus destructor]|uniref:Uncharacterized protein n=1 Tax=Ditylenchus destructor TaxID=166010 RepID=A0AAD4NAE6_9BILA|nr:hypothetical protein DdX_07033 [Ditylenchus destructor]
MECVAAQSLFTGNTAPVVTPERTVWGNERAVTFHVNGFNVIVRWGSREGPRTHIQLGGVVVGGKQWPFPSAEATLSASPSQHTNQPGVLPIPTA